MIKVLFLVCIAFTVIGCGLNERNLVASSLLTQEFKDDLSRLNINNLNFCSGSSGSRYFGITRHAYVYVQEASCFNVFADGVKVEITEGEHDILINGFIGRDDGQYNVYIDDDIIPLISSSEFIKLVQYAGGVYIADESKKAELSMSKINKQLSNKATWQ